MNNARSMEYISQNYFETEIPFFYENGTIIIEVVIEGKKKKFIIDSGAGTVIKESILSQLDYKSLGKTSYKDTYSKKKKLKNIQLHRLDIGGIEFCNIVGTVSDFNILSKAYPCTEIEGIIGYNVLNKAVWDFNFIEKKIIITDRFYSAQKKEALTFRFDNAITTRPLLNINIDGVIIGKAMLDLGSNGSISLPSTFFERVKNKQNIKTVFGNKSALHSKKKAVKIKLAEISKLKINTLSIPNLIKVSFEKDLMKPLIGTKFLENYRVILNRPERLLILKNYSLLNTDKNDSFGFTFFLYNSELKVSSVMQPSIAFDNKLRTNDKLLKINDTYLVDLSNEKYCDYLQNDINKQNHLNLRVERDGQQIDLILKK
jgi:6-pyruvoyl-tetrahydropterin synthase